MQKRLLILAFLLPCYNILLAQVKPWQVYTNGASDASGKIILGDNDNFQLTVIGEYKDSIHIGAWKVSGDTLGAKNIFWTTMNMETGQILSISSLKSTSEIKPVSALRTSDGAIYMLSELAGEVVSGNDTVRSVYDKMPVMIKINSSNQVEWIKLPIAPEAGVKVKPKGIVQTGINQFVIAVSSKNFLNIEGTIYKPKGGEDIFLLQMNTSGQITSVKGVGSIYDDKIESVTSDQNGNIYIGGIFSGTLDLGEGKQLTGGSKQAFIAKFNSTMKAQWGHSHFRAPKEVKIKTLQVDHEGYLAALGEFEIAAVVSGNSITTSGKKDMLVMFYDPSGNFLWVDHADPLIEAKPNSACFDKNGNLYIVGEYKSGFRYYSSDTSYVVTTCENGKDATGGFLVRYSRSGEVAVAKSISGVNGAKAQNIWIDFRNDIYVTGNFNKFLALDTLNQISTTGVKEYFTAKIDLHSCKYKYDYSKDFINYDLVFLHQNYPNPTAGKTYIQFHVRKESHLMVDILDMTGKKIDTITDEVLEAANYVFPYEFPDDTANGLYLCRLIANGKVFTKTIVLVR